MSDDAREDFLRNFFEHAEHRLIHKWTHYFDIYERHFACFRGKPMTMLEIGVFHGGSLQMWKQYFGPEAHIYGVDVNPRCATLAEENINIIIGDQGDRSFLKSLREELPPFDIVIDDGGHQMVQQIQTFEELFPHVKEGGVYVAEDLQTSFMAMFGGGRPNKQTFLEYSKSIIDHLYDWWRREPKQPGLELTRSLYGMHYYSGMLVIDKRTPAAYEARMRGRPSFPMSPEEKRRSPMKAGQGGENE